MKHLRFFLAWGLFALLVLSTAAPGGAQEKDQEGIRLQADPTIQVKPSVPPPPLVPGGPAPDLELLYTSEVRGFYQPCG